MATVSKEERRRIAIDNLNRGRAKQQRRREAKALATQPSPLGARSDAAVPAADPAPVSPTVCLYVPNAVVINGTEYSGHVEVRRDTADTIRSLSSGVETEKKKMYEATVHPDEHIGHIG